MATDCEIRLAIGLENGGGEGRGGTELQSTLEVYNSYYFSECLCGTPLLFCCTSLLPFVVMTTQSS